MSASHPAGADSSLVRALGVRALAAMMFNIIVGGGVFGLPTEAARGLGPAAPVAYVVCAVAMGLIVLCFAEAGSRVSLSGGPYAYIEVAMGGFVGFLGGLLLWLVASFAAAAVASVFAGALAFFWPALSGFWGRAAVLGALFAILATFNIRGVREGTRVIETVTVAKLLPLVLFVVAGAFFVDVEQLHWEAPPELSDVGRTSIVLFFAFAGIESALVPSGEVRDFSRTVPRALFIALTGVTLLYIGIQVVAQGVLGAALAREQQPLAAAAARFAGPLAATVMAVAAAISTFGNVSGMTLATPRALFAFGRDGLLPRAFAKVHPRFRTPHIAIAVQSAIVALLAITGSFGSLAILAVVSTLVLYLMCCVAAWELRRRDVRAGGTPFRVPGGPLIPVAACLVIVWLLTSASLREFVVVGGVLVAGAVLFMLVKRGSGKRGTGSGQWAVGSVRGETEERSGEGRTGNGDAT